MGDGTEVRPALDRRDLVLGAATLAERIEWARLAVASSQFPLASSQLPVESDQLPSLVFEAWLRAFSPGNPQALARRLAWDSLTPEFVVRALTREGSGAPGEASAWLRWFDAYLAECRASAGAPSIDRTGALAADGAPPPFVELLLPALVVARRELEASVATGALARFRPEALGALGSQLLRELSAQTELMLLQAFTERRERERAPAEPGSRVAYERFVGDLLNGSIAELFDRHPVAARHVSLLTRQWVISSAELVDRLAADRNAIADRFSAGIDPGDVVAVEPALSDPHHGRRRVARLTFASGLHVIYKPRDLALETAFSDLLADLTARGLDPAPPPIAILPRAGYGWVEQVSPGELADDAAAENWFRRAGALLCIVHLLRGRDLHMDNVIATVNGPVLVDLELLLQPVTAREQVARELPTGAPVRQGSGGGDLRGAQPDTRARDSSHARQQDAGLRQGSGGSGAHGSCLATGFVSDLQTGPDGTLFDVGGLRGDGSGVTPVARRDWVHLGSDAIAVSNTSAFRVPPSNTPSVDGERLEAVDFADEILDGFERAYRLIHANRPALLDSGGALDRFAGAWSRVVGRPTDQYAAMLHVLAAPRYQQSGAIRSVSLDALNRPFMTAVSRPALWTLAQEEQRALEALDVPVFHARTDDTGVYAEGRLVSPDHFVLSGLEAVRLRISSMSDEDMDFQLSSLQRALWEPLDARFSTALVVPPGPDGAAAAPGTQAVAHALWIAGECLALEEESAAVRADAEPLEDFHLYDGALGVALLHAAVAATTGDEVSRSAALAVLDRLGSAIKTDRRLGPIGACAGTGSIVYGLTCLARLLNDDGPAALALEIADRITGERIAGDDLLDISGGAAGAAVALLALHAHSAERRVLELAVRCGEHLLATRVQHGEECAWTAADGRRYVGFAHGAAGIGVALVRLFRATGRQDFLAAAAGAHRFERRLFESSTGNWPVASGEDGPSEIMTAWCHGAPGIVLARTIATIALQDPALLTGVTAALRTTAAVPVRLDDHLCCGSMGRCDVLLTAGEALRAPQAVAAAWRIAGQVTGRAARDGRYRLTSRGHEFRAFDTGFFRGLSGIGYQLLRLAAPSRVPSVLAFDLPPVSQRS